MRSGLASCTALVLSLLLCDAAAAQPRSRRQPGAVVLDIEELQTSTRSEGYAMLKFIDDPLKPFNEFSLGITKPVVDWVLVPCAKAYRVVVVEPVRKSISRVGYNITYPDRFVSLLLQGELEKSAEETGRFVINTTVGVAGLFDPAARFGFETYDEDVGQAFGSWGIGPGFYLFIPLVGPSSARDAVGLVFDTALNPLTWLPIPGLYALFGFNDFTFWVDDYEALVEVQPNLYVPVRALWSIHRQVQVENFRIPPAAYEDSDPEPSLGVFALELEDPTFREQVREMAVDIAATARELPYSVWMQPRPAPLLFLIPGVGAHRSSSIPLAVAEMAYRRGYSVVVVSSPFHPEFILNGLSNLYPGYTASDAADLYAAMSLINEQLEEEFPAAITARRLLGYSLGALQSLFIAGLETESVAGALHFDRIAALNPPTGLIYAGLRFEEYFDAPLSWPAKTRDRRIEKLAMKAFLVYRDGIPPGKRPPFDRTESKFLIGLSGRVVIMDVLNAVRQRATVPALRPAEPEDSGPWLESINQSSFPRYAADLALPYFDSQHPGMTPEQIVAAMSLYAVESTLRHDERVRVITNANDFIISDDGLEWLRRILGERVTIFPGGGHLGNLHDEAFQDAFFDALAGP